MEKNIPKIKESWAKMDKKLPYIALGVVALGSVFLIYKACTFSELLEKKNKLEQIADVDGNRELSIKEKAKMYEMCGVADKPSEYVLNLKDIQKGFENYNKK